ncbi:hypothetical protein E2P81_ATG07048 [Venturia nashicola]|nr:hypothetical protein E2P81_ATG07048 [Venturia nashicola]
MEQHSCQFDPTSGHSTSRPRSVGKTIKVRVGLTKQSFYIHGPYLIRTSEFFKAALRNPMIEAATGIVNLPDEATKDFLTMINVPDQEKVIYHVDSP